jgi:tripartite-type tricarboxylate transporter receptor subunit TctC
MWFARLLFSISSLCPMLWGGAALFGQTYPGKPIRIVTQAPGGGGDFMSRLIAQGISGPLGQPVIVDNRATVLASAEVASKAAPDGYVLLVVGTGLWISPLLQKVPYETNDFSPISLVTRSVNVVAVHPSLPVRSLKELIALAKSKPGALNYGSDAVGGRAHLSMELLKSMARVNIVNVTYKGNAATITALLSGEVQMTILDAGLLAPHVKSGKLRALAVTSAEPTALAPGLPTVAASGLPGYESGGLTGIFAPAKTPSAIIARLNQEILRALSVPEMKDKFMNASAELVVSSPEQFAAIIKADVAATGKVIKDAGIKID